LLNTLAILPVLFSTSRLWLLYPISSILLLFIAIHFFLVYSNNKNKKVLVSLISFLLLFLSRIEFVLASKDISMIFGENRCLHFVAGHMLEAIAYILLLSNLVTIIKHEQKKK